jgi:hypothetical protein
MLQGSVARSLERRFALTAEYGVKAGYAKLIAQAAALSPAKLTIRSVVQGGDPADATGDIKLIERRGDGAMIVETPRYRAFTKIILALVGRNRVFQEIAGNREILVTILTPSEFQVKLASVRELFQVPLQARPGWVRRGVVLPVDMLGPLAQEVRNAGAGFEHAYDY